MDTRATSARGHLALGRPRQISLHLSVFATVVIIFWPCLPSSAQEPLQVPPTQAGQRHSGENPRAEAELQVGISLTRQGRFEEAIPHFLAAQGRVRDEYALGFDLALCYLGTGQYKKTVQTLNELRSSGHATSDVYNLLAQANLGIAQPEQAFDAFQRAATLNPKNERLYTFVAEAAMDHQYYTLGIDVLTLGLERLPKSSRLYYKRGVLYTFVDQADMARNDLELASKLAPGTDISFLAASQKAMLEGNIPGAVQAARDGVEKDPKNYVLLTLLGQGLIRAGASPGQPEFAEAQSALERAIAERPGFAAPQLALGKLHLMAGRLDEAVSCLEAVRQLSPDDTAVYSQLARAYRRQGRLEEAKEMLATLNRLNQAKAAKYKSGPPDQRPSYMGRP